MRSIKWQWVVKGLFFGTLFIGGFTFLTMWLWNSLVPGIFGLTALNFWQTLGLMVLGRLLTGGFAKHGGSGRFRGKFMRERWQNMSEAERQQYMQRWGRHRCGPSPEAPAQDNTQA